jgi:hypothetical protein
MKYLKTFENVNEPEVGYFVIGDHINFTWAKNIIKSNIGEIIKIDNNSGEIPYNVSYDNDNIFKLYDNEILHFSKNKEDLEIYIQVNKYNL